MAGRVAIWRRAPLFLALTLLASAAMTAPAAAYEYVVGPPKEEVVSWRLFRPLEIDGPHVVTITLLGGFCGGEPEPLPGSISIVELPVSEAHPRPTALITAHQFDRAPFEVVGEVLPGEPPPTCAGLGWSATRRIRLKRPVKGMKLVDDSFGNLYRRSPPGGMP